MPSCGVTGSPAVPLPWEPGFGFAKAGLRGAIRSVKQHRSRPCCSPLKPPELSRPHGHPGLGNDTDRPPAPVKPARPCPAQPGTPFPRGTRARLCVGTGGWVTPVPVWVAVTPPLGEIPAPPQLHDRPRGASGEP